MNTEVWLNKVPIKVFNYKEILDVDAKTLKSVTFDFEVRSEEYHTITTLLYDRTFDVNIPSRQRSFQGEIYNYSTSITNLYEKNQVGIFHLELREIK
ncbi:DUF3219 family protein [Halalkalibacter krulwichiae]|uniref:DUF3219 domain-containing protein n=1 Tax=Halalkalibacter krulwichiae TaxID=199441 RepID=A0A1X9MCV3_9BACI|nr:DUF3219 family protein [Halalkalibacter krulwichiae]ARK30474.1 hypothetical protein BkAM31D_11900 [Halalkalibacter krulwichiae]